METNPYVFNLSEVVEYSRDGEFHQTASLEFSAPTMAEFELAAELSQLVMQATLDARKFAPDKDEEADDQDLTPDAVKMLLLASQSVKFTDIADVFKKLAVRIGTVDGKTPLASGVLSKISIDDFTGMICGYIANFTFPSLFSGEGE
ncbi:MAG: hypothetical protein KAS32_19190 [Candidatus Peribacteraceae bacterium]|nr:hypothetical protein [Candidatus Peribacteraceae bacterium]